MKAFLHTRSRMVAVIGLCVLIGIGLYTSVLNSHSSSEQISQQEYEQLSSTLAELKETSKKIEQLSNNLNNQVNDSTQTLDEHLITLQQKKNSQTAEVNTASEDVYKQWKDDYISLVEQEGYYLQRYDTRINKLDSAHQKSIFYIDDIIRQNNELFNLFTPVHSKSIIQQNDILSFKLNLQKPAS